MSALIKLHSGQFFQKERRLICIIAGCIVVMMTFNILLDYWYSQFHISAFYLTEALLFSTHWCLYLPLLFLLVKLVNITENLWTRLAFTSFAIFIHMIAYPAFVWSLSEMFYNHTFDYWQTFNFGLSAYFIKTILVYGFLVSAFTFLNNKIQSPQIEKEEEEKTEKRFFISSILVSDSNYKKLPIQVNDILYFSANSPYINIYHASKKYLHTETLKSLEMQLDNQQFIRIHKSHIVNITKIATLQSRQNGDYDITLSDHTTLRVSRNYAKNFKSIFEQYTHLTIK